MELIPVLSGKGGVGKTTVCVGVALALRELGHPTGILDLDLENPSLGTVCGLERADLEFRGEYIIPPRWCGIPIMSLSLLPLPDFRDTPTLIDDDRKYEVIYQLAGEIDWEDVEILMVDMPPGSGAEVRGLLNFPIAGTILVSSPQQLSEAAVRRVVAMTYEYGLPITGILENNVNRAPGAAGERIATEFGLSYFGKVGWTRDIVESMENHQPFSHRVFTHIAEVLENSLLGPKEGKSDESAGLGSEAMVLDGGRTSEPEGVAAADQAEVSGGSA